MVITEHKAPKSTYYVRMVFEGRSFTWTKCHQDAEKKDNIHDGRKLLNKVIIGCVKQDWFREYSFGLIEVS